MIRKYDPTEKFYYMEEDEVQLTPSKKLSILKDDLSVVKILIFIAVIPPFNLSILLIIYRKIWGCLFIQIGIVLLLYILFLWKKHQIREIEKFLVIQDVIDS